MTDRTYKRNDTWPPYDAQLIHNQQPFSLEDATSVRFLMGDPNMDVVKVDRQLDIIDASQGLVRHHWQAEDTDIATNWSVEIEVTKPGGITTFPSDGYNRIRFVADIA